MSLNRLLPTMTSCSGGKAEQTSAFLKNLGIGFLCSQFRSEHQRIGQWQQAANIQLLPL